MIRMGTQKGFPWLERKGQEGAVRLSCMYFSGQAKLTVTSEKSTLPSCF